MKNKSIFSISGILILLVLVVLINGISSRTLSAAYIDLTEDKLYTLTPGTLNILNSIEEEVTLKFFFSKRASGAMPALRLYATRVEDLLKEYERQSSGKIRLVISDPEPDSESEEWAQKYGITPLRVPTGVPVYLGMVGTNALGEEVAIPVFELGRQEFLEYDISKLLFALTREDKPVVGIISPLQLETTLPPQNQMMSMAPPQVQRWVLLEQLDGIVDVRKFSLNMQKIPDEVDVLVLLHPKNLPATTLYAIDQYVLQGGNLIALVDPYASVDKSTEVPAQGAPPANESKESDLNNLTERWGIKLKKDKVVSDLALSTQVAAGRGAPPQEFPVWLTLGELNTNRESVVTGSIDRMVLPWAGALELVEVAGIKTEPLLQTSIKAHLEKSSAVSYHGGDPKELIRSYIPDDKVYPLAAISTGKFASNYPNGPDEAVKKGLGDDHKHLSQAQLDSSVLVVADVDFVADRFAASVQNLFGQRIVQLLNDNLVFFLNAIESMAGSVDLISIRSRGKFSRPFTKVQMIERTAQLRWSQEEMRLKAKLSGANQRLRQLQSSAPKEGQQVLSKALLEEIKKFRDEKLEAQRKLREIRRNVRKDKEALGNRLFLANTFGVPLALILGAGMLAWVRGSEDSAVSKVEGE